VHSSAQVVGRRRIHEKNFQISIKEVTTLCKLMGHLQSNEKIKNPRPALLLAVGEFGV
jgi:hypothetical protein